MATIKQCEFLTSLKVAGKVYVRGTILYPPLPHEVVSEIECGSNHLKIIYEDRSPVYDEDTTSAPESGVIEETIEPTKRIRKKKK
jgi:hypothetical protein